MLAATYLVPDDHAIACHGGILSTDPANLHFRSTHNCDSCISAFAYLRAAFLKKTDFLAMTKFALFTFVAERRTRQTD